MPTGMTRCPPSTSASWMATADTHDTSCSAERPPKRRSIRDIPTGYRRPRLRRDNRTRLQRLVHRDRVEPTVHMNGLPRRRWRPIGEQHTHHPVSYTHLTLPTIYSV